MSSEHTQRVGNHKSVDVSNIITPNITEQKKSGRVDINQLMFKVREKERKIKKDNLLFFGLVGSIICVAGIILSF
jgi:hypothetical protein